MIKDRSSRSQPKESEASLHRTGAQKYSQSFQPQEQRMFSVTLLPKTDAIWIACFENKNSHPRRQFSVTLLPFSYAFWSV